MHILNQVQVNLIYTVKHKKIVAVYL